VSYYSKFKIGDMVWVLGDESNDFISGYGLVIERRVVLLDDSYMLDVYVLHDGKVYRPFSISRLGVLSGSNL